MTELEKATWEFLFDTPSVSLLKHGRPYSDLVEAVTSDREKAFKAGAEWQKKQSAKKAVELFLNYCEVWGYTDYYAVEEFRKEMEE